MSEIGSPEWRRLAEAERQLCLAMPSPAERDEMLEFWSQEYGRRLARSSSVPKSGPVHGTSPVPPLVFKPTPEDDG